MVAPEGRQDNLQASTFSDREQHLLSPSSFWRSTVLKHFEIHRRSVDWLPSDGDRSTRRTANRKVIEDANDSSACHDQVQCTYTAGLSPRIIGYSWMSISSKRTFFRTTEPWALSVFSMERLGVKTLAVIAAISWHKSFESKCYCDPPLARQLSSWLKKVWQTSKVKLC